MLAGLLAALSAISIATQQQHLTATALSLGGHQSCALIESGRPHCWSHSRDSAQYLTVSEPAFTTISLGQAHGCGITAAGELYCWGSARHGAIGDGGTASRRDPVRILPDQRFLSVSTGWSHSCALSTTGQAWCWGSNRYGQLGDGSTTFRREPVQVSGNVTFTAIHASKSEFGWTCALSTAGTAYCWGRGSRYVPLGVGDSLSRLTPTRVAGSHTFASMSVGSGHACALTAEGAAWCWGDGRSGQLGNGDTVPANAPVAVSTDVRFSSISTGSGTCAVALDGFGHCWGANFYGQLGSRERQPVTRPARMAGVIRFRSIIMASHGSARGCGIAANNDVWCWGDGRQGELGDGERETRYAPVRVLGPASAVAARAPVARPAAEMQWWPEIRLAPASSAPALAGPGRIAWMRKPAHGDSTNGRVWIMNADGTRPRALTDPTLFAGQPVFNRTGTRLAFWIERLLSYSEIYVMSAGGAGTLAATFHGAESTSPTWSPDGARLAYSSNREDGNVDVFVTSFDGAAHARLTAHDSADYAPAWSPDGNRIAFVSERDGNPELYVMNADGSAPSRLTTTTLHESAPAWSPDGRWIAFHGLGAGNYDIYVMSAQGGAARRLTDHGAPDLNPAWSPDGSRLAFSSERDGNAELYAINVDGSGLVRLTNDPGEDRTPSWGVSASAEAIAAARPVRVPKRLHPGHLLIPAGQDTAQALPVLILFPPTFLSALSTAQEYGLPANDYAVIAVRGFGHPDDYMTGEEWQATIEHYERQALADLATLMRRQRVDTTRIYVGGFSMGGDLAWALALRNPARFAGALTMGSRNSYRARPADHRMLAARGAKFFIHIGQQEEDQNRLTGARSAARLLQQLGVAHRLNEIPGGHSPMAPTEFVQAIRFLIEAR